MDDGALFDRFHAALDVEPRPGAYERLRNTFNNPPAGAARRPAFRMRWTKMALRITAAVAVAAVTLGVVILWLTSHHSPVGNPVPATDRNAVAYRTLMNDDYNNMTGSTSNHCNTIDDAGCADALAAVVVTLRKWDADLQAFQTPARYKTIDGMFRTHLSRLVQLADTAVRFQKANDVAGFNLAMSEALYERAWIDPATFVIEGSYRSLATSYRDAVNQVTQASSNCLNGTPGPSDLACAQLSAQGCQLAEAQACELYVEQASTQLEDFALALTQFPAPARVATQADVLQNDIVQADAALQAIAASLSHRDSRQINNGESAFSAAISAMYAHAPVAIG